MNTVSFPILASNFPCFAINSSRSSGDDPAISIPIKFSPKDVVTLKNLTSDNPYTFNLSSDTEIKSLSCLSFSGISALMNALAPPRRSRPVLILVKAISSIDMSSMISFVKRFIISISLVWIVSFCVSFSARLFSWASAVA